MFGGLVCFLFLGSSAVANCKKEEAKRCSECDGGYYLAKEGSFCVELGCVNSMYCLGCTNGDPTSTCIGCTSGYSTTTITTSDESLSITGCLRNLYHGVCVILGVNGCTSGCELDLDVAIDTGELVWYCLEAEPEEIHNDEMINFTEAAVVAIIIGITILSACVIGVLVYFLACV